MIILFGVIGYIVTNFPPVMTRFAATVVCSCVYVMSRSLESVKAEELQVYPFLDKSDIQLLPDTSVTARILWHKSKAIYRKGLDCTLLAQQPEEIVRQQKINIIGPPPFDQDTVAWPAGNKLNE